MRSTMMATPLQVSRLVEYGSTVHGDAEVVTWTGAASGPRRSSLGEVGRRAAQLAHALRDDLGVTGDQRIGTLMWNNAEHLAYIVNHAEDRVVIVDDTVIPLFAGVLPKLSTVEHVIVVGDGDAGSLGVAGKAVHRWDELLAAKPDRYEWPLVDENDAAALCYTSGTTGNPKGVAYSHRSIWLHSMQICMAETFGLSPA